MSKCEICQCDLAEYEEDILDCGHYACNSHCYDTKKRSGMNVTECSNCFESTKPMEDS